MSGQRATWGCTASHLSRGALPQLQRVLQHQLRHELYAVGPGVEAAPPETGFDLFVVIRA